MITTLLEKRSTVNPIHPRDPALAELFGLGNGTASKIDVTADSGLKFATVYACVRIISETIASLPLHVYEHLPDGGRARVSSHPANWLLSVEPNPDMSAILFRETMLQHVLLSGNSYARIIRTGDNKLSSLEIRDWHDVRVGRDADGRLEYKTHLSDGDEKVSRNEMLHIPGLASDGIMGKSPITLFAESIGLGIAAEQFAGRFFGNAARPSVAITMPAGVKLGDKGYADLIKRWGTDFTGENAWKPAVLEMGADVKPISMLMSESEIVAILKMSVAQIARVYRVPLHMLAELDRATFSNIEQQSLEFEKHTIRPWLVRIEQEYNRKLFTESNRGRLFIKHSVDGLLRGDIESRYRAYQLAFMNGWRNLNEIRELEDLNMLDEKLGGVHFVPVNLQTLELAITNPQPVAAGPAPAGEEKDDVDEPDDRSQSTRRYLTHLLTETVDGLVQRESHRAREYAKNPQTFVGKLESFYAEQPGLMLEKLGAAHAGLVSRHVAESKRMLLTAAECPASKLVESVESTVSNWPERATALAEQVMEGVDGH